MSSPFANLPTGIDGSAWKRQALLTPVEMGRADSITIENGTPGYTLMLVAGEAVADAVCDRFETGTVAVLCGPGNNGGDGFVAAKILASRGWSVRLGLLGDRTELKGDAAQAAADWVAASSEETVEPLSPEILTDATVVIDAVFGAGLNRDPEGSAAETLSAIGNRPVVAVDVPSGLFGANGACNRDITPKAAVTVTFFRGKPGHKLLPGRVLCGDLSICDIGIDTTALNVIEPKLALNRPDLWASALPEESPFHHKYSRGYLMVAGGPEMIGAACLATRAAQRAGVGMVTVAAPLAQAPLYRLALQSAVVRGLKDTRGFLDCLEDARLTAALIGPGLGDEAAGSHERVLGVLRANIPAILDADALSIFADSPDSLFQHRAAPMLLTPHMGEFARLFPDLSTLDNKVEMARRAAERSGAVVLLKGYDTVIADPSGWAVVNDSAPPTLAVAGAGDVLAGLAAGLIAKGMPVFAAACAAAYLHGVAADRAGSGLIAEDLPDLLPEAIERSRIPRVR
ncbi:NAD(P)H-hydrate dehydratase [Rhodospirillaceae bacterium KN72]|uniref:Bifunctional NAD(P)H-hydrate repair enzyme n=2 Tax=Pacificispira spongiicola TaxID=2729598 RepID=A0A7Y0E2K0_9PROT|nr:NAD(P)H-hydrate dehydratase [Pacificispira spongiicola]